MADLINFSDGLGTEVLMLYGLVMIVVVLFSIFELIKISDKDGR